MSKHRADHGVPSATAPDADVEPHGGQESPNESEDGTYVDGNLDIRGDVRSGPTQASYREGSLDDDHDTSMRTDGRGHGNDEADASVPNDVDNPR